MSWELKTIDQFPFEWYFVYMGYTELVTYVDGCRKTTTLN